MRVKNMISIVTGAGRGCYNGPVIEYLRGYDVQLICFFSKPQAI